MLKKLYREKGMIFIREGPEIQGNIGGIGLLMFHEILFYDIQKRTIGYWINSWEAEQH